MADQKHKSLSTSDKFVDGPEALILPESSMERYDSVGVDELKAAAKDVGGLSKEEKRRKGYS